MFSESRPVGECLVAPFAQVWLFAGMGQTMDFEAGRVPECLGTPFTLVRLFAGVDQTMLFEA